MEVEKVVILTDENDLERVDKVLNTVGQLSQTLIQGKIIYGRVGKNIILSFNVEKQSYHQFCDKLFKNRVTILSNQYKIDVDNIKPYVPPPKSYVSRGWSDLQKKVENQVPMEKFVSEGNYQEIIKITKDIRNGQKNIDDAIKRLPEAVNNAIEKAIKDFHKFKSRQSDSITSLIEISSNGFLRTAQFLDLTKRAAIAAVDLLATRRDELYELINLSNNNKIHWIGPVSAIISFVEITFSDKILFDNDIDYAVKKLNLRWLDICMQMVEHEFTDRQIEMVNSLIDFIRAGR